MAMSQQKKPAKSSMNTSVARSLRWREAERTTTKLLSMSLSPPALIPKGNPAEFLFSIVKVRLKSAGDDVFYCPDVPG